MSEIRPIYAGEAQLVRWADSGAAGRTITLRIDEHTDVHPFKGLKYGDSGQRFEIAVVAKNDDEEPLDADHARKNASRHKARAKASCYDEPGPVAQRDRAAVDTDASVSDQHVGGSSPPGSTKREYTRSQMAAIKCGDESFQIWLGDKYPKIWDRHYIDGGYLSPQSADRTLKEICGIESKKELDVPGAAQAAFDKLLASYDYRDQVRR